MVTRTPPKREWHQAGRLDHTICSQCACGTSSSSRLSRPCSSPAGANASTLIDRNATGVTLKINAKGQALLSYTAHGQALERPRLECGQRDPADARGSRQVEFKLDYSGGWGTYKKNVWKTFKNTCGPYTGPAARVARDRVHGAGRQPLGGAVVAADAAELRPRARTPSRPSGSSGSRTGPVTSHS